MENEMDAPTPFTALFVFGDSLSDNGAIFSFTGGTFPPSVITGVDLEGNDVDFVARGIVYDQKFTNGDVYADVAVRLLGAQGDTSTFYDDFSGSNFAVGGATATDLSAIGGTATNTYADQVAAFQEALAAGIQPEGFMAGAAASVFIGLNDLGALGGAATATGEIDQDVINAGVQAIVGDLITQTQVLAGTGVGTIILNTLPGGSFFPNANPLIDAFGPETAALFDSVSAGVNTGINGLADSLRLSGVTVEVVDFYSIAQEVQMDASTFGFLTLENALPNSDPVNTLLIDDVPIDQIGFIDPVHFTDELHEVFGAFQAMTLGNTQLDGDDGNGTHMGGDAHETIFARGGNDRVMAAEGHDLVFGGAGNDQLFAGTGDDVSFGGTGNDLLIGDDGSDVLSGGAGNDVLIGGAEGDVMAGNDGNDVMFGGAGGDVITDGLGNDVVFGDAGDDIVIYRAASTIGGTDGQDRDTFFGGTGMDTLLIVSDTAIDDVDGFLAANNVRAFSFENTVVVSSDALESYDFGTVGTQVATADLFGLI